jgi:hypothetical protein
MDDHDFNREMQDLCKIGQDPDYLPIKIAPPRLDFNVSPPRTEAEELYEQITGCTAAAFDQAVKGAYQTKSDLETIDRLGKAIDVQLGGVGTDPGILAKSVARSGTIPFPYEATCMLCNLNFMSKAELDGHDRAADTYHQTILRRR